MDKFDRIAADFLAGKAVKAPLPKYRDPATQGMFEGGVGSSGKGKHHNRNKDVAKGRSRKQKHKKNLRYERYGENQPLMMRHDYGSHTAEDIMSEEMYARVKSRKHHSKKDVEDSMKEHGLDKNPKWLEYEGRFDPSTGEMEPPKEEDEGKTASRLASIRIEEAMGADGKVIRLHDQIEHGGDLAHVISISYDPRTRQKMIKHKHVSSGKEMTVPANKVTLAKGVSRRASDSYHGGSYMSYQNIGEMLDALDVLGDMIHKGDELDDWVEDKISHAHQIITDLARYFAYGEGYHTHDEEY